MCVDVQVCNAMFRRLWLYLDMPVCRCVSVRVSMRMHIQKIRMCLSGVYKSAYGFVCECVSVCVFMFVIS